MKTHDESIRRVRDRAPRRRRPGPGRAAPPLRRLAVACLLAATPGCAGPGPPPDARGRAVADPADVREEASAALTECLTRAILRLDDGTSPPAVVAAGAEGVLRRPDR